MGDLQELSKFVSTLRWEDIPREVRESIRLHVLDNMSAAVGAVSESQIRAVAEGRLKRGEIQQVSLWGRKQKASLSTAVFLNAMMGHTLELDDVHVKSKTHIGTVVIPAAWGVADYLGKSGRDFLTAVVCGYETMSRIGMAFDVSEHRNRGWHVTATAGTFGAAAAAASLLGMTEEQTEYALGLAGAQSFGTWAFLGDGASCKVLNPARAAQSGVEAAFLAKEGMTGPRHILTASDGGLLNAMSNGGKIQEVSEGLGKIWECCSVDTKPYPACRSTHCAIDGTLQLQCRYSIDYEQVQKISVYTYQVGYKQCGLTQTSRMPETVVNAKFSTPYGVACALVDGEVTLKQFTKEQIERPEIRKLLPKIAVEPAEEFTSAYPKHWGCRVEIETKCGEIYHVTVPDASGSVYNPLTEEQTRVKAMGLMRIGTNEPQRWVEELLKLPEAEKMPDLSC